jgi:hypothetical protein
MAVNLKKGDAGMQKENSRMFTLGLKSLKFKMRKRNSRFDVALMTLLSICMGLIFVPHLDAQEMIDPHSGLMVATATDLIVDAGAINLEVQRSLQLRHSFKGMLGAGWQMNWETRLYPMADFVLIEENGLLIRFDPRTMEIRCFCATTTPDGWPELTAPRAASLNLGLMKGDM